MRRGACQARDAHDREGRADSRGGQGVAAAQRAGRSEAASGSDPAASRRGRRTRRKPLIPLLKGIEPGAFLRIFTPLLRSSGGIDRWNDPFDAALHADDRAPGLSAVHREDRRRGRCPDHAVQHREDGQQRIPRMMIAVAGFGEHDIEITAQENIPHQSARQLRQGARGRHRTASRRALSSVASALPIT